MRDDVNELHARIREAQEAYWPVSAMWTDPGTWAAANSEAGRVSTTTVPACWSRRTSLAEKHFNTGSCEMGAAPFRFRSTSCAKYSGATDRLSVSRWTNWSLSGASSA